MSYRRILLSLLQLVSAVNIHHISHFYVHFKLNAAIHTRMIQWTRNWATDPGVHGQLPFQVIQSCLQDTIFLLTECFLWNASQIRSSGMYLCWKTRHFCAVCAVLAKWPSLRVRPSLQVYDGRKREIKKTMKQREVEKEMVPAKRPLLPGGTPNNLIMPAACVCLSRDKEPLTIRDMWRERC